MEEKKERREERIRQQMPTFEARQAETEIEKKVKNNIDSNIPLFEGITGNFLTNLFNGTIQLFVKVSEGGIMNIREKIIVDLVKTHLEQKLESGETNSTENKILGKLRIIDKTYTEKREQREKKEKKEQELSLTEENILNSLNTRKWIKNNIKNRISEFLSIMDKIKPEKSTIQNREHILSLLINFIQTPEWKERESSGQDLPLFLFYENDKKSSNYHDYKNIACPEDLSQDPNIPPDLTRKNGDLRHYKALILLIVTNPYLSDEEKFIRLLNCFKYRFAHSRMFRTFQDKSMEQGHQKVFKEVFHVLYMFYKTFFPKIDLATFKDKIFGEYNQDEMNFLVGLFSHIENDLDFEVDRWLYIDTKNLLPRIREHIYREYIYRGNRPIQISCSEEINKAMILNNTNIIDNINLEIQYAKAKAKKQRAIVRLNEAKEERLAASAEAGAGGGIAAEERVRVAEKRVRVDTAIVKIGEALEKLGQERLIEASIIGQASTRAAVGEGERVIKAKEILRLAKREYEAIVSAERVREQLRLEVNTELKEKLQSILREYEDIIEQLEQKSRTETRKRKRDDDDEDSPKRRASPKVVKKKRASPKVVKKKRVSPKVVKKKRASPKVVKKKTASPKVVKKKTASPKVVKKKRASPKVVKKKRASPKVVKRRK